MFTSLRLPLIGLLSIVLADTTYAADCAPDQGRGAQVFANECAVCHSVAKGMTGMMGPNLAGVVGRKSGSLEGFNYSQAMRNKDIDWQADEHRATHHPTPGIRAGDLHALHGPGIGGRSPGGRVLPQRTTVISPLSG